VYCVFATVFDLDADTTKEHRETFERYKKLVSAFSCCVVTVYLYNVIVILSA